MEIGILALGISGFLALVAMLAYPVDSYGKVVDVKDKAVYRPTMPKEI